ncbi:DNA-binding response regulator [Dyadobacter beijingensis]|uniref:DNA-binding response regulator n=1 Tax=Dyadobacter beijingensis TaxID=365489 RepID=A0ABQ2HZS5_9BACT|nr:LytTR family DNA-binding domain-containing protein [Dyadobacter beijingensis]GGM93631.1 DNA-binding response regulator [Dyadobacter beijingensis]
MNKIKCLIIDDEPSTAGILQSYIRELDALELVGTYYDAVDALVYLQQNPVDLLFMDVMLPKITGDAFLKLLPSRPRIIFLANRRKRWIPGYDEYVLDCLVKPIAFEDFVASIDRCYESIPPVLRRLLPPRAKRLARRRGSFVYLYSGQAMVKVYLNEVLFIEGVRNYARVKTIEKDIVILQGLAALDAKLSGKGFMRIHRSVIASLSKITAFGDYTVEIGPHIFPVSKPFRARVLARLRELTKNV